MIEFKLELGAREIDLGLFEIDLGNQINAFDHSKFSQFHTHFGTANRQGSVDLLIGQVCFSLAVFGFRDR